MEEEGATGKDYSVMEVASNHEENSDNRDSTHQVISSYLKSADFKEIICCVCGGVIIAVLTEVPGIPLNIRPIPYQTLDNSGDVVINLSLDEEFTGETVSSTLAVFIAFIIPVIIQFILSKTVGRKGDAHKTICVYAVALGLTGFATNILKSYIGYLRPVFYNLCEPNGEYSECMDSESDDARKSFPSGHSSLSFCGLTLLTLYLLARFGVYSGFAVVRESPDGSILMKYKKPARIKKLYSVLALAPMAVAGFVAASRVVDNKHFPADVVGGAVLGTSVAWFVHDLWYPAWPSICASHE